jgi:translation initiation factor IF-3
VDGGWVIAKDKRQDSVRINDAIRCPEVRVIGPAGQQVGVLSIHDALREAEEANMDLVEVSPTAEPPVCRIMNYGKYKFQQNKKLQDAKKKQKTIQIKELKFRPRIDEHDYGFKVRNAKKFLEHGDKVRVFVQFRGREMSHKDLGLKILDRIREDVVELANVEKEPSMEGNRLFMTLTPKAVPKKT